MLKIIILESNLRSGMEDKAIFRSNIAPDAVLRLTSQRRISKISKPFEISLEKPLVGNCLLSALHVYDDEISLETSFAGNRLWGALHLYDDVFI